MMNVKSQWSEKPDLTKRFLFLFLAAVAIMLLLLLRFSITFAIIDKLFPKMRHFHVTKKNKVL